MDRDPIRENLNKFTRKAFHMIPPLNKPCILDIGCGSGIPTMELARLSDGQITALDIDQFLLDKLSEKIEGAGISDRVKIVKGSMFSLNFPGESFDIIWAEGSIASIGFKRGLIEWRPLMKPEGFMIVHDEASDLDEKRKMIPRCGYKLLDTLFLSEKIWWKEYYHPLEKKINKIRKPNLEKRENLRNLEKDEQELEMFKKNPQRFASIFFIMQKMVLK
jgi:ubiquinone/menaquinone biosynthesis C-methylase UbiE